jgi:hypothetical protein
MADEIPPVVSDQSQALLEGTFEIEYAPGKISAKGLRLFLIALIVVTPVVLVMCYLSIKNPDPNNVTRLYEIALMVLIFFFGRASTGAKV